MRAAGRRAVPARVGSVATVALAVWTWGCAGGGAAERGGTAASPDATPADLVIRDVRVFDGERVLEGATVVVRDGRVAAVGADLPVPDAREAVDGAGRTLLPGLIDAHTHTFAEPLLVASLAFGVTTVLDMFTSPELAAAWARAQAADGAPGRADIFSAGIVATAAGGHGTQYGMPIPTVDSAAMADAFVADRVAEGSDYLKIIIEDGSGFGRTMPTLDAPRVRALVRAAHDRGLLAVVHPGSLAAARLAVEAGADGLVHIWLDGSPDAALLRRMRDGAVFVVPTLSVSRSATGTPGGEGLLGDERVAALLDPDAAINLGAAFPASRSGPARYDSAVAALRALREAGIRILAGTDAPNPGTTHGASMHGELDLLVDAGLTPTEALAAATAGPADAFGLADRGRIRPGARADLVLVAGDPTVDIRATRAIEAVWKAGVRFDREGHARRAAAAREARARAEAAPARGPGMISDFDAGAMEVAFGAGWSRSTDAMMGGSSTVTTVVEAAGEGMALRVSGEVRGGVPFPWSGVMLSPGTRPMEPANLSGADGIAFRARGDGTPLQVLLFHERGGMAPVPVEVPTGPEWREHVIPWSRFRDADGRGVMGVAFVASTPGTFEFWLDDVGLR